MEYTVQQLAKVAGISVRTLHYYDEIGLLTPSFIKSNGYRVYEEKELLKLQQILFFRELEFPLEQIIALINSPKFNSLEVLQDQKKLLQLKRERTEKLLQTLDDTIKSLQGGEHMSVNDLYGNFSKKQMEEYQEEAKRRWGHTDAYKQSQERTKNWTKADYARIAKEQTGLTERIAVAMQKGFGSESSEVQTLIQEHFDFLKNFYEPSYEMYKGLGQMYVDDPRFTAYYEKFAKGLSIFMRDAMNFFCDQHKK